MTRRPPLGPHCVAVDLWFHVVQVAAVLRFHKTPARPDSMWLFLAAAGCSFSVTLGRGKATAQKGIDRCAPSHIHPRRTAERAKKALCNHWSSARWQTPRARYVVLWCRLGQHSPGLRAHAPTNDGLSSYCRLRQGWIGCDTSFLPTTRERRTTASPHGCTPSQAK